MGNRRSLIAAAAIVLAAAAGLSVYFYVSGADERAQEKVQLVEALVAVRDIPKGTSGAAALADGSIAQEKVLRGSMPPSAIRDVEDLGGRVASATIQAKQFITDATFVSPSLGGGGSLAAAIATKDLVAVTISVDQERSVAGQIAPGDKVDVAQVLGGQTLLLLENAKVLAVGSETAANAAGGNGQASAVATASGLITFELSRDDALRVIQANKTSQIYLILKPLASTAQGGAVAAGR